MMRAIAAVAFSLVVASSHAQAMNFGITSELSGSDGGNGNLLVSQAAVLPQSGTIQSLSFYVNAAAGKLVLGVYDPTGANGGPGKLLAQTVEFTPGANKWNTQPTTTHPMLAAGNYWLAYLPSSNSLGFPNNMSAGSYAAQSVTFGAALPASFPSSPFTGVTEWSFYGTVNATPQLSLSLSPFVPCSAAPGSKVAVVSSSGGDGNAITLSMAGDVPDFALNAAHPPASLLVGPNGIAAANCGKTFVETITATQN